MKSFVFAIVLIAALLSITIIASVYTDEYADRLIALAAEADAADPDGRAYAVEQIRRVWDEAKFTVCISVHRKEVTRTETLIDSLDVLSQKGATDAEYYGACRLLKSELRHIKDLSRPSLSNIL